MSVNFCRHLMMNRSSCTNYLHDIPMFLSKLSVIYCYWCFLDDLNAEIPPLTDSHPEIESTTPSNEAGYEDDYPIPNAVEEVTPAPVVDVIQSVTEETTQSDTDQQLPEETTQGDTETDMNQHNTESQAPSPPTENIDIPAPSEDVDEDLKAWLKNDEMATQDLTDVVAAEKTCEPCNCTTAKVCCDSPNHLQKIFMRR